MFYGNVWTRAQGLVDDAVSLSKFDKSRDLIRRCIGYKIKEQSYALKSDRDIFGNAQRAAKVYIAFGSYYCVLE